MEVKPVTRIRMTAEVDLELGVIPVIQEWLVGEVDLMVEVPAFTLEVVKDFLLAVMVGNTAPLELKDNTLTASEVVTKSVGVVEPNLALETEERLVLQAQCLVMVTVECWVLVFVMEANKFDDKIFEPVGWGGIRLSSHTRSHGMYYLSVIDSDGASQDETDQCQKAK